ncbi:MAG: DMT family transporter [Pseudomonadota bacterium]
MSPLRSIGLKILSVASFMVMATLVKICAAAGVPGGELVFFRSAFAIPVIFVWLALRHDLAHGLETKNPFGHVWRGLVGAAGMACGFTALGLLPLPEVTAISYATPILIVIFAAMFLGETVRVYRLSAVLVGMLGVAIVLSPKLSVDALSQAGNAEALGAVIALMGATFAALAQVFIRRLTETETTPAIVFYFSLSTTILALFTIPFGWVMPAPLILLAMVASGVFGGLGQIFLTSAYRGAQASLIAPFEYVSMLMALGIGYAVFQEVPTHQTLVGAAIIMAAGLFIIWRERQLGLVRGKARPAMTPQG